MTIMRTYIDVSDDLGDGGTGIAKTNDCEDALVNRLRRYDAIRELIRIPHWQILGLHKFM